MPDLFFDAKDHELLQVVNHFPKRDSHVPSREAHPFFEPALHPHGIKELAASQEIRTAYAVINLLDTLAAGRSGDRINALRALRDEVLYSASSSFRYNTGRVLIQIMKSLVRARGDDNAQLRLAHDFRKAASGRRRIIRQMLKRYYLLEMPEEWNQLAFDHHVHDANTKGRKSPTHLIMDAWIKGIRNLDVIYYNYADVQAVSELVQAAAIMDIKIRVGIEFQTRFRGRHVQFVWVPLGFADYTEVEAFLSERPMLELIALGKEASQVHTRYVLRLLDKYNNALRFELNNRFRVNLREITETEFLAFVGVGQPSRAHLAELVLRKLVEDFQAKIDEARPLWDDLPPAEKISLRQSMDELNDMLPEDLIAGYFSFERNPAILPPYMETGEDTLPALMRMSPQDLMERLTSLRPGGYITLNLTRLRVEDVLELLYECRGMISHLELFNLKNYLTGEMENIDAVSELLTAVNDGSAVALKRLIRNMIGEAGVPDTPYKEKQLSGLKEVLRNIPRLQGMYANSPLRARIGSDSISRSSRMHGMGFVFPETLPARARRMLGVTDSLREYIPIRQDVYAQETYYPKQRASAGKTFAAEVRSLPCFRRFGTARRRTWLIEEKTASYCPKTGNIATLGGIKREVPPLVGPEHVPAAAEASGFGYMNTTLKNVLKVAFGFSLTAATFAYTQTWWFLAWFGPLLWFGITGFRNVVQAVLGGGGIRRTPLLRWNDYLSWSRLCDSLMYTGISVPLLELGVRVLLLEKTFAVSSIDQPLMFYAALSFVNGLYISTHNLYRGLPRQAIVGNLFRSVLAVPVSVFYSFLAYEIVLLAALPEILLLQGGAVISKTASDSVAAMIEGFADKNTFLRIRRRDYAAKTAQLFQYYARLEVLLPEEDVLELLLRPNGVPRSVGKEIADLEKGMVICALDLMYFWMYQPRARGTFEQVFHALTKEEQVIFVRAQFILRREHEISRMLVDGLAGNSFSRPLEFYLARYEEYVNDMSKRTGIHPAAG